MSSRLENGEAFFKLPTMGIILAPFESGKTSLLQYLTLCSAEQVVALVIFSKDGIETYETNYDMVNRKYVHNTWDKDSIQKVIALGRRIKRANPNHHIWVLFDDFIGMTKGFFKTKEAEELITTLRSANCSLFVSAHQIQEHVTTLIRNNGRDVFIFRQSEPNGIKMMYDTWGVRSSQFSSLQEFRDTVVKLPPHHFLHFNSNTNIFTQMTTPHPHNCKCGNEEIHKVNQMPKFRLYLHPDDKKEEERGYLLVYGNKPEYNLSSLERHIEDENNDVVEDDGTPLFRDAEGEQMEVEAIEEGPTEEDDHIKSLRAAGKRKREKDEEDAADEKKGKRKKKEPHLQLLDEVNERRNIMQEQLPEEDAHLRLKILRIFKLIQRTENHDKIMLNEMDNNFLQQDFDAMSFDDLLKAYTTYCDEKEMNKVVYGTAHRYNIAKNIIHQAARHILDYQGDPSIFTGHLDVARHDSTIRAIAESTPGKKVRVSGLDNFLNVAGPVGSAMYAYWVAKKRKEQHDEKLNSQIPKAEADILMERIDDL